MEPVAELPTTTRSARPSMFQHLRELWQYRGLLYQLVLRELKALL